MEEQVRRYVGIDLAKRTMEIRILQDGHKVIAWNQKTDQVGRDRLASKLLPSDLVAVEACGAAFFLARFLMDSVGCEVFILNPGKLAMIWASTRKTDAEDALKLARFIQRHPKDELPLVALPDQHETDRRVMTSELESKKGLRIQLVNRLHTLYQHAGTVNLVRADLKDKEHRNTHLALLKDRLLLQAQRIGEELDMIERHIAEIEEEIRQDLKDEPLVPYLTSIPGVGIAMASAFLAHVGDGSRFSSGRQVANYAGMTPRIDASGETVHLGGITKKGCTLLRSIAVKAAWSAVMSTSAPHIKYKFEELKERRGSSRAIVAIARHLLEVMWAVAIHKEFYRTSSEQFRHQKLLRLGLYKKSMGSVA